MSNLSTRSLALLGTVVLITVVGALLASTPRGQVPIAQASAAPTLDASATSPLDVASLSPTVPSLPLSTIESDRPTPVPGETLGESDAFWERWAEYPHFELPFHASSLAENIDLAHLVVRGHITDIYIGEKWERDDPDLGPLAVAYVTVAVSEVLKGSPVSVTPGHVEVAIGSAAADDSEIRDWRSALPQHDALWFLMHDVTVRPRPSGYNSDLAPFAYFETNDMQGVIRGVDGQVRVIQPQWIEDAFNREFFPLPLEGTDFNDLIEQVRGIAAEPH